METATITLPRESVEALASLPLEEVNNRVLTENGFTVAREKEILEDFGLA